jgi:hypothetical protein
VDGLVNLVGITIRAIGKVARLAQTGYVQNYLFIVLLGVLLMLLLR